MKHARGFTMVELMIALVLGLLISAAAIQLFLANQISMNFQRGMDDVQSSGRFALDQMVHDIRLAGLGPAASATSGAAVIVAPFVFSSADLAAGTLAVGAPVTDNDLGTPGPTSSDGAGVLAKSDQIVVQRLAVNNTVDCEGNAVTAGNYIISRYFIGLDAATNVPALMCDGAYIDPAGTMHGYNTGAVALVDGIDSFQVLYGIDNGTDGNAQVARYITSTAYSALAAPKPVILSVRIGLFMQSQDRAGDARPPSTDVQILDQAIVAATIPNDGLLRRLFVTTVSLRNASATGV